MYRILINAMAARKHVRIENRAAAVEFLCRIGWNIKEGFMDDNVRRRERGIYRAKMGKEQGCGEHAGAVRQAAGSEL